MKNKKPSELELAKSTSKFLENELAVLTIKHQRDLDDILTLNVHLEEQKKIEEELRESEERYRELIENTTDLIQSVRLNGSFLYVNRAWRETLGYSDEEVSKLSFEDIVHPEHRAYCTEIFRHVMEGKSVGHVETVFITKDGREIMVEGNASCYLKDGKPYATRGTFRDVTERRKLEKEKKAFESELILSEKTSALGKIAAGIAHEINNPASAIQSDFYTLIQYADILPESPLRYKMLEIINRDLEAVTRITDTVLAIKGAHRPEEWHYIDANKEIDLQLTLLKKKYKDRIQIKKDYGTLPRIKVHSSDIGLVILNILDNAIDAIADEGEISISTHDSDEYVSITIKDSGEGIPSGELSRIFNPFYTTKDIGKGTGLGLYTSSQIVENHNGKLYISETNTGQGTTFVLEIPKGVELS